MKEKLVENWLISASERSYQVPLCSLLGILGYKVIHSTRHCAMEMGKDIIAEDAEGNIVCFQLKALKGKRLTLSGWRQDLQQQLLPLVMGKVVHPSAQGKVQKAVIVATGYFNEEVVSEIEQFNQSQAEAGYPNHRVELWTLGDLTKMFSDNLNSFGPSDPEDFKRWLELFLDGGRGLPDKDKLFILIENILESANIDSTNTLREAISFIFILVGSICSQYSEQKNFVSEIETWLVAYFEILHVQFQNGAETEDVELTRSIISTLITTLLSNFSEEYESRKRISEFDAMFDTIDKFFTPQGGALIALYFLKKFKADDLVGDEKENAVATLKEIQKRSVILGEVSVSYLFIVNFSLMALGEMDHGIEYLSQIVESLAATNKDGEIKLPSPQYDLESMMLLMFGEDIDSTLQSDDFEKSSFLLRALVFSLVSLDRRKEVDERWKVISYFKCEEFQPDSPIDLLKRRAKKGINWSILFDRPQSWESLKEQATELSKGDGIPQALKDDPIDLLLLIYSQPYRLTAEVACYLHENYLKT